MKRFGGAGRPPLPTIFERKKNQGKQYIVLKGIYQRFQIRLNNCKITKFRNFANDFVSLSQESRSGEIGENFKLFLDIVL